MVLNDIYASFQESCTIVVIVMTEIFLRFRLNFEFLCNSIDGLLLDYFVKNVIYADVAIFLTWSYEV